jgi:hypothetical protein
MAKLEVAAVAGPSGHHVGGALQITGLISVTMADDGSAVTGLTEPDFDIYWHSDDNITSRVRLEVNIVQETASWPEGGVDGMYFISAFAPGESTYVLPGVNFLEVRARSGNDAGQTVTRYLVQA